MPKVAVYFCNGIGNLLMLTPALQALSHLYDDSKIDMVIPSEWSDPRKPVVKQILNAWDLIGKVIEFPQEEFNPQGYTHLWTTGHNEPSQAFELFKQRGNQYKRADWVTEYTHEVDYYMEEVYRLGYVGKVPEIVCPIATEPILDGDKPRIAFYNGAAALSQKYRWERKRWDKFAQLAKEVYNYYQTEIVYLGGKSEEKEGEALARQFEFVTNYAGKLSFLESAKALSQCRLMISSDSSLMHVAEAVNVPVVALFGATLVSKNRPYSGKYKIVRSASCPYIPCQGHTQFTLCKGFICMKNLTVEQVMKAIRQIGVF